jgi:Putative Ig domain
MFFARLALLLFIAAAIGNSQVTNGLLTITTPTTLIPAVLGVPYSQALLATGGTPPYAWFLPSGALPAGLTLSPAGLISGRLDTAATTEFPIEVTDNASATATLTFSITALPRPLTRFGAISHVAAGGLWDTSVTLINTSSVPIAISALFRADDGTQVSLPLKLTQQGVSQSTTASSLIAAMNPNSTLVISTGPLANAVVGWADLLSSGPVSGFAVLRSTPTNDKPSEATVPLQTSFPSTLTLPYDNTAGYVMGVALVNLELTSAVVNAKVWDENGTLVGVQQIAVPANGHRSFVLTDALSLTAGKRGIVQFQNPSGGVSSLGLHFSPFGPFTNVPVMLQQ